MKIYCVGYRSWALDIYKTLKKKTKHRFKIHSQKNKISIRDIKKFKPKYILFYGWSDKVPNYLIKNYFCIMLHPSPLPKFRGGSPIQNQIIRNIKSSKVTLFKMNEKFDSGPIILTKNLSLDGHIKDIFYRLTEAGVNLTLKIFKNKFKIRKQNHKLATYYKRRKPSQSQLTINELKNKSGNYIFNKIRMLEDPYPNAYIKAKDGKKIKIKYAQK